jgi:hypothetical protein
MKAYQSKQFGACTLFSSKKSHLKSLVEVPRKAKEQAARYLL